LILGYTSGLGQRGVASFFSIGKQKQPSITVMKGPPPTQGLRPGWRQNLQLDFLVANLVAFFVKIAQIWAKLGQQERLRTQSTAKLAFS